MDWQGIISILGLISGLIAIMGVVYNIGKMSTKLDILWSAYEADARSSARWRGTMEKSSEWKLTNKGQAMIPEEIKKEIDTKFNKRTVKSFLRLGKSNPNSIGIVDIIKSLGGISSLTTDADRLGIPVSEFIAMIGTYIKENYKT